MLESMEQNSEAAQVLTAEHAIAHLRHEDLSLRYYAAWWLGKFRVRDSAAIDALIAALADEADRTALGGYPLRRNAARALGKLGDRTAVPALTHCLACDDFYVREAAAQSLGMLGDPVCVPTLSKLLAGGVAAAEFVPGRPHLTQPYEAAIEALGLLSATEATELIRPFMEHSVTRVRYAATRAMYQLTHDPVYAERLVEALKGDDVQLRRTALSDLGAIGYLPAAEAITAAAVESSFKLIALKGLLDHHLPTVPIQPGSSLGDRTIQVLLLMDSLL
jgi:phycocyanobilin lyase alpha subunit